MVDQTSREQYKGELESLVRIAKEHKATDVYLTTGVRPELRIAGNIRRLDRKLITQEQIDVYAELLLTPKEQADYKAGKDVDFGVVYEGLRMRGNAAHHLEGGYFALRSLPDRIIPITELGFPNKFYERAVRLRNGLVLVTGSTGSGKSTTLASIVNEVRKQGINRRVITIEDPIEYVHHQGEGLATVVQRQVPLNTPDFKTALRSAVRQNPDTIMIGEIRDLETLEMAISAADTGHLVLSTLHTSSTAESIQRMANMRDGTTSTYPVIAALASNLRYIIGQKLVPTTQGGVRLAVEVLYNNNAVRNNINKWAELGNRAIQSINNAIQTGTKDDMIPLDKHLKDLQAQGVITKEIAIEKAYDQVKMESELNHKEL